MNDHQMVVFPSKIGWMAVVWCNEIVEELTFGHESPQGAITRLATTVLEPSRPDRFMKKLSKRLQAFASGKCEDTFQDVELALQGLTEFQHRHQFDLP